jgi:type II secretion system protein J
MTNDRESGGSHHGYSLIEMLLAMAVLAVLVVLLAQVINTTSQTITKASGHMLADGEAQLVFDRLADDIAQIINRNDVDSLFIGLPTNSSGTNNDDQMYFYTQGAGFSTNSTNQSLVALVGYRVNHRKLERLGVTKSWDDLSYVTPSNSQTGFVVTNPLLNLGTATNYFHVISPSVFRMEIALLMKTGTKNADGSLNGVNSYANITNSTNAWHGLTNVMAIVVAFGILDQGSRKLVTDQQLDTLALSLPDASTNGGVSIPTWTSKALTTSAIPVAARSQIRIYQRSFPVKR